MRDAVTEYVFNPSVVVGAPIKGARELYPVRRVYCIGRNYAAHALEMGHDPDREPPFFFQKNPDNLNFTGKFPYPAKSTDVHHEIELVVALKTGGTNIAIEDALTHVYGYALGLDMTRRDLQAEMKKMGRPWEIGKAFEHSAPMGPIVPAAITGHPSSGKIALNVNGSVRQTGDVTQLIWKIPEMIAYLSEYYELAAGDLIFSGTPAGVAAVEKGDVMVCQMDGFDDFEVKVT